MSAEEQLPFDLDELPLVARTDLRDVRVVSIIAHAPDVLVVDANVHASVGAPQYRIEDERLFVRLEATARYTEIDDVSEQDEAAPVDPNEVGSVTIGLVAELEFRGGVVSQQQVDELVTSNLFFMLFPYVRSTLQQVASDLRLPQTVLPYLRRQVAPVEGDDPPVE